MLLLRRTRGLITCGLLLLALAIGSHSTVWAQSGAADSARLATVRISNVFFETDLREALISIADQAGVAIIPDQSVHGYVTMEINRLPIEKSLERLLTPFGLTFKKINDGYLVGSARPDNPSFHMLSETELYRPNFIKAADIPKLLSSFYEPYVRVNSSTNSVSLCGPAAVVERIKEDLRAIDQAPRQIMIEALITEVSEDHLKEFGLDASLSAWQGDVLAPNRAGAFQMPLGDVSDSSLQIFGMRSGDVWDKWSLNYELALRALFMDGKVKVRASPRLATAEGQPARIFVGKDEYHTIGTYSGTYFSTRLEVIKVGITLEIVPYVAEDGRITVEVKTTVSDVAGMSVTGLPVVSTRDVDTKITVQNGESIVIGGLQNETEFSSIKKLPLLGDIPILGALFRNTSTSKRTSNIIIVITPRLVES